LAPAPCARFWALSSRVTVVSKPRGRHPEILPPLDIKTNLMAYRGTDSVLQAVPAAIYLHEHHMIKSLVQRSTAAVEIRGDV